MIEGLDYAIQVLERGAARHKFYASGDFSNASEDVKVRHLNQMEACLGAVKLLKRKRSQYIKERRKTVRAKRPAQQAKYATCPKCKRRFRYIQVYCNSCSDVW